MKNLEESSTPITELAAPGAPEAFPSVSSKEKSLQQTADKLLASFPEELLLEIMVKLGSLEDLLRFSGVSKRWHHMVHVKYKQLLKNVLKQISDEELLVLIEKICKADSVVGLLILFLDKEIDVNKTYEKGRTLLHIAAIHGSLSICGLLLQFSPESVNSKDEKDRTPLHLVGTAAVAEMLILHGAAIESVDKSQMTPLFKAVERNSEDVIECLIKHKANINAKRHNQGNWTPLHVAFMCADIKIIKLLLKSGADPRAKTSFGCNPWELAEENPNREVLSKKNRNRKINYYQSCLRKLVHLELVKNNILNQAKNLESGKGYFFQYREKGNAIRTALNTVWKEVYPQIFEESTTDEKLESLLLNIEKNGISVKKTLEMDTPPTLVTSFLSFFGKDQNNFSEDFIQDSSDKNFGT